MDHNRISEICRQVIMGVLRADYTPIEYDNIIFDFAKGYNGPNDEFMVRKYFKQMLEKIRSGKNEFMRRL